MKKSKRKLEDTSKKNENGNKTFQNLWDAAKAIQRGMLITIQAYFKNKEKSQKTPT